MDFEFLADKLKKLLSDERFNHSLGVMETSEKLAVRYGADVEKAKIAGLLHDCAKNLREDELVALANKYRIQIDDVLEKSPSLLHGPVGGYMIEDYFGVHDDEIKRAIMLHTTGDKDMTLLDKIIFLADYIEPNRNFEGVENLRDAAYKNIDEAVIMALDETIKYVLEKGQLLYQKTVIARNDMIIKTKYI
ncbi:MULTISPECIES: bis(5'-nucleosyl)-tetraphosphatase (symmetrical) YqeK [Thermoanaerobacterium]|uniref:bis(5'-nucleosyl)-tetraphosphatase (symmetrical) n=2 Tax=Thermoanaerobacterium TaxID=28895 RepID=W9EA71_9THEO|nr:MULTISPECIES: bis(5'-nucleosyl)-tetraphosphatase (symmetrical) YqeK [Thermoanaerobacterium]AFK87106.1 metal dependent phosphohydrolase [Thermoanaerobacterium saccharolyticum JW/SL-YS485]ETO38888.1 metal dependent phosphohydrolase [Thermoanaerobacterium aotearoense SCUT27]